MQIVGLTASVGVGKAKNTVDAQTHILRLCANLDAEKLCTVKKYRQQLMRHTPRPSEGISFSSMHRVRKTYVTSSWAKTINVFRACLGAQLTICAQEWRNFVLFSTVSLRFVLSRVCVFLYSLGPFLYSFSINHGLHRSPTVMNRREFQALF